MLIDSRDYTVNIGEVVAIVGGSGTGKTTLLSKLAEVYSPLEHKGKIERSSPNYAIDMQSEKIINHKITVKSHLDYLENLGSLKL